MALFGVHQIHAFDDVDDLTKHYSVFHVLVNLLKNLLHNGFMAFGFSGHLDALVFLILTVSALKNREKSVVDKVEQLITSQHIALGLAILVFRRSPVAPAQIFGDNAFIFFAIIHGVNFPFVFLSVVHLQEKQPYHLFYTLGITIDTSVLSHLLLDAFY